MIDDKTNRAIDRLKNDIENTMLDFQHDNNSWVYYISIYAKDRSSLIPASILLKRLDIRARNIILIPKSYKECSFDCVDLTNIFTWIKSELCFNTKSISIIERDSLNDGDFYVSVVKESIIDQSTNIIMTYNTLHSMLDK